MSELKAGGLAMIIGAKKCPENIGKVVMVEYKSSRGRHLLPSGKLIDCNSDDGWVVSGVGLVIPLFENETKYLGNFPSKYLGAAAKHLMPINDPGEDVIDANEVPRKGEVSA